MIFLTQRPILRGMNMGRLLFLVCLALAIVLPVRLWVIEPIYIATASMEPTLPVDRHLFVDKLCLRFRSLKRGDIIVLHSPTGEEGDMVKRVVALPGERVELREKKVFVDNQEIEEPYVQHKRANEQLEGDNLGPLTVPEGGLFVLGDNRDESKDSSAWVDSSGQRIYFIPIKSVVGLVRGIY